MSSSLEDLNIVAIPAGSAQPTLGVTKKRKKNNKYERRRQKAKKAKQQNEKSPSTAGPDEYINDNDPLLPGGTRNSIQNLPSTTEKNNQRKSTPPDKSNSKTTTPVHENERPAVVADETPAKKNAVRKDSSHLSKKKSKKIAKDNDISVVDKFKGGTSSSPSPESKKLGTEKMDDDEERAKYMAEFHARPMELDRRSGARSATIVSRDSSHIFTTDTQSNTWESLHLYPRLVQTLRSSAFGELEKPTGIQAKTIRAFQKSTNAMMKGNKSGENKKKNVLVHSETGSGKTLAYAIPILQSLAFGDKVEVKSENEQPKKISRSEMGCRCIILCPTRELASQTLQVLERLCQSNFAGWIVPGGLLGGDSRKSEKASLRKGLAIVVATPGRLLDHLHKTQSLALSLKGRLKWLVLDEADRLLDMGLGDQVRQIVQWIWANEACSSHQQPWWRSVLVSATITPAVQALAKERILCGDQDWVWVNGENKVDNSKGLARQANGGADDIYTESEDFTHSTPRQLAQFHITVTAKLRLSALVAFLVQRVSKGERTVVFMGTCASVDFHYELFNAIEDSLWDNDDGEKSQEDTSEAAMGLFGKKARVFKLHGSVSHSKRGQTMKEFNASISSESRKQKDRSDILLTTDVSARGLNLKGVDWTVQYDPPCEISDYVHRVGRVARAGKAGHSLLFLLPSERKYLDVLETKGISKMTPLSLSSILNQAAGTCKEITQEGARQQGGGGSRNSRSGEHFAAEIQRRMEECVVKNDVETRKAFKEATSKRKQKQRKRELVNTSKDGRKEGLLLERARDAFFSFLRAYSTKKEPIVRSIFSSRALHFGHVARSFALKEPPKSLVSKQKSKREQQEGQWKDEQANLPQSLEFGKSRVDLDELLNGDRDDRTHQIGSSYNDDDSDTEFRSKKRRKLKQNGKSISAKALLLENAAKIQNNLMDAM